MLFSVHSSCFPADHTRHTQRNVMSKKSRRLDPRAWHVWFVSRSSGRRLSTWQMTATSCPTALGALCGQLKSRPAWRREHSAVTARELLQPLDLACGTIFRPSCQSRLFRRQLNWHLFREAWTQRSVTSDVRRLRKTLTYLLTYLLRCRSRCGPVLAGCWQRLQLLLLLMMMIMMTSFVASCRDTTFKIVSTISINGDVIKLKWV